MLRTYGSYPQPLLLLKALPADAGPDSLSAELLRERDPAHRRQADLRRTPTRITSSSAGSTTAPTATASCPRRSPTGRRRVQHGAPAAEQAPGRRHDQHGLPGLPEHRRADPRSSCAFGTCHSSPQSDFYMTCGDGTTRKALQLRAGGQLRPPQRDRRRAERDPAAPAGPAARRRQPHGRRLLPVARRRDLAGRGRPGPRRSKAHAARHGPQERRGSQFFEANVHAQAPGAGLRARGLPQPRRLQRLPPALRARRASSRRARSRATTRRRCNEFMALDTVDVRQSRAVKKNILASSGGITHRAGRCSRTMAQPDASTRRRSSAAVSTPTTADDAAPSACFKEWHRIERQDRRRRSVSTMATGDVMPLAFVSRPPNGDKLLAIRHLRGRRRSQARRRDDGRRRPGHVGRQRAQRARALRGPRGQDVDVRGPEWSYDGTKLIFAARPGAASGCDLWVLDVGGRRPARSSRPTTGGGIGRACACTTSIRCSRPTARRVRVDARGDA